MAKRRIANTVIILGGMGCAMYFMREFTAGAILFSASGIVDAILHSKEG